MFIYDRLLKWVQIVSVLAICLVVAVQNDQNIFETAIRSLSLPANGDMYDHKCTKEVPTMLTIEEEFQRIEGNGSNGYWTSYEVCCDGYKRYKHDWNKCVPDCGGKCRNGLCVQPNKCECFPGYVKNDDGECVQTCPLGCLNGKCDYEGKCTCNIGYTLDRSRKFCRPVCRVACKLNQNCSQPDVCECLPGYQMHYNGECRHTCNDHCPYGRCVGPNICLCEQGYKVKDGICQTQCYQRCYNGICVQKDVCKCNEGFMYDQHLTSCIPFCENCVNGTCIEPNVCRCFKGFRGINGACISDCPRGCNGGSKCIGLNQCKCTDGAFDALGHCRAKNETKCVSVEKGSCVKWAKNLNY